MKTLNKIWYWVRWPLAVVVVFYILLVIYRIPAVGEQQRTADTVAKIQAQKVTLADVMGDALPPVPNTDENNATVAGIDSNNNGIRDDVELAIFAKYPNSAKIRAAELQYGMEAQLELSSIFNQDTWVAVAKTEGHGIDCFFDTASSLFSNDSDQIQKPEEWEKEVEDLEFNTPMRTQKRDMNQGYQSAFASGTDIGCDIDLTTLPN